MGNQNSSPPHQPPRRRAPSNPSWGTRTADAVESPTPRRGLSNPLGEKGPSDPGDDDKHDLGSTPHLGNKHDGTPIVWLVKVILVSHMAHQQTRRNTHTAATGKRRESSITT